MNLHEKKTELFEKYCYNMDTMEHACIPSDLKEKQLKNAVEKFAQGASRKTVIGFIDTTMMESGKNGYLFTEDRVYYLETLGKPKKLWYDDIKSISVGDTHKKKDCDRTLIFELKDGSTLVWKSVLLYKTVMCRFFQELLKLEQMEAEETAQVRMKKQAASAGIRAAGLGAGAFGTVNKGFEEEKFHAQQGHGFAAERANTLFDRFTGHDAKILGDDNAKNGADRMVDGVYIQSKYCAGGTQCINACFEGEGSGTFRYMQNGKPMQIEVPADEEIYNAAVKTMERKIENGQVPGVTDTKEAKNIVRKGHFTYKQARNIAKAGTVESLTYDAATGAVIATSAFGVTAVLTFAASVWNGEDMDVCLHNAVYSGLKVAGTAFVTSVLASQLSKAGLNSALVGSSEQLVRLMGPKASAYLINAFRLGSKPIYGAAAMKSAAKLLRGNAVTAGVTVAVLSTVDVIDIFRGRISGTQLMKNLANTASTVAGGTAGWVAGAAVGSAILPGVGTVVGGLLGSLAGGGAAGNVSKKVTDAFAEDDADEVVRILQNVFEKIANEYLLNQKEAEKCADRLGERLSGSTLKDIFASSDRFSYAREIILPIAEDVTEQREYISLPADTQMVDTLKTVLEELSDEEA